MADYITVAAAGMFFGGVAIELLNRKIIGAQRRVIKAQDAALKQVEETRDAACDRLLALRSNCFITNERGHRVRYVNASVECRAVAEKLHAPE